MANTYNKYQLKRTSVSGRTPNTTNSSNSSFLDTAELALNLTDKKMFSSNGTALFEVGANLSSLNVTGTANIVTLAVSNSIVVPSINVATLTTGNVTVNGYANISGTLATGNTTITGTVNVSSNSWFGNTLFIDAANNKVGINVQSPEYDFHVVSERDPGGIIFDTYGAAAPNIKMRRARGTKAAPTPTLINDGILTITAHGYGNSGFSASSKAAITMFAAETWTDTAQGTYMVFGTTNTASTTRANRVYISANGNVGIGANFSTPTSLLHVNGTLTAGNTTVIGLANVTTLNSGNVAVTGVANVTGNVSVTDTIFGKDVTLTGNLTVSGTTTYINTVTLNVGDNIVTLNADLPIGSAPTENAGIEINRGSSANVQFLWDETNDRWTTDTQPMYVGGTLTAGNTTITGFANVSGNVALGQNLDVTGNNTFRANTTFIGVNKNYTIWAGQTGTPVPDDRLNFKSVTGFARYWFDSASASGGTGFSIAEAGTERAYMGTGANTFGFVTYVPYNLSFRSANGTAETTMMLLDTNTMFVGIGTTTPSSKLHVVGTANITSNVGIGGTLATGNTTVTGFANVSTTLNVVGAATVNGAFTVNNTAAVGNTTITGSANVSTTLNVVGAATVNGAFTVNNTAALGNTTVTGFVNVSSYGTFGGAVNAASVNIGANVTLTTALLSIGNSTVNTQISAGNVFLNGSLLTVGNTTINVAITDGSANLSSSLGVGSNVSLTTTQISIGNTTVNTVANSTLISNRTIGGPNTGIMLNGMNMFAFSNSGGNEGNPTFRSSVANNQTVLRVLPNGVVNVATQTQFEFFGVDYFSNTTNWHNLRILAQTDRFVIDTARGANTDPARPIVFDIGGTGQSNATNANYPAVLVLSANGKVGISNATPDATLTVTGTANISGNVAVGGTLTVPNTFSISNSSFVLNTNVSGWHYTGKSLSVAAKDTGPTGVFVSPDGTKLYIVGTGSDSVHQYTLSTPYDISTGVFALTFSVSSQDGAPSGLFFKPDGTKMYVIGYSTDAVHQYSLATAWNISTATYDSVSFSVLAQDTGMFDIHFSPDGTKMYTCGTTNDDIYQYTLSTPWVVSSATLAGSFDIAYYPEGTASGLALSVDGTKLYVHGYDRNILLQYTLTTPWDITTSTFVDRAGVYWPDGGAQGMSLNESIGKVWFIGSSSDAVYEYDINDGSSIRLNANTFTVNGMFTVSNTAYIANNLHVHNTIKVENDVYVDSTTYTGSLSATGTLTLSGATTAAHVIATSATTGTLVVGGNTQTGAITVGQSTGNQAINIATGATLAANLKTVNIGTGGVSGSFTNVNIGSSVSGANNQLTIYANTAAFNGNVTISSTANVATAINVGANVFANTTALFIGNATINSTMTSTNYVFGGGDTQGIGFFNSFANYFIGMKSQAASQAGRLDATSDYNMYFQMNGGTNRGFVFRGNGNASNGAVAQIDSTGNFYTLGSLYLGNTATNTTISTSLISIGNSTVNTQISAGNVFLNGSLLTVGNTTVNTSISNGTANVSTLLNVGANVNMSTTQLNVGNTTVNAVLTSASLAITNAVSVTTNGHEFVMPATTGQFKISRDNIGSGQGLTIQTTSGGNFLNFNSTTGNAKPAVLDVPTSNTTADIFLDLRVAGVSKVKANSTIVTITGAANVTGPFAVNNTAALGNTTITGFANASSLNVVGAATVNGAFVVNNTASVGNTTITGSANVSSTLNVVGNATVNGALTVNNTAAFGNTTITGTLGTGNTTITGSLTVTGNTTANNIRAQGSVQIDGNLTVSGNTISIGVTNLSISDNLISLNEPETVTITSATSNATSFIYTANNGFNIGQVVTVSGMTPIGYNVTSNAVTFANATTFAVANTVAGPGAYVSGGTAVARVDTNPDIGFTGNYNDGTYRHAGFFRDATDGVFKVFDQYLPEPTGAFINTANASFRIADFQANNTTLSGNTYIGGVSGSESMRVAVQAGANRPIIVQGGVSGSLGARLGANENLDFYTTGGFSHYFATNGPRSAIQFAINNTASAVNYISVTGGATGGSPYFLAAGTDTNIGMVAATKGSGAFSVWTNSGTTQQFNVTHTASAVNYIQVSGSATGSGVVLSAQGSDSSVRFNISSKGSSGVGISTNNFSQLQLNVVHTASAVNYVEITGAATGGAPYVLATGSDTDVPLVLSSKGAASILFKTAGTAPTQFAVTHTASADRYVQITGGLAGTSSPSIGTAGGSTTFNIYSSGGSSIDFWTNGVGVNRQLSVAHTASAVNYVQVTGAATGANPTISAQGSDTNVNIFLSGKGTGYPTLNTLTSVGGTATNAQTLADIRGLAGNVEQLRASLVRHTTGADWTGVGYRFGQVVDVTAMSYIEFNPVGQSQGLAVNVAGNSPFQVKTSGGEQFRVADTSSAVNYVQVTGAATGSGPIVSAQGSDTDVRLNLTSKGTNSIDMLTNSAGTRQFRFSHTASAVNYLQATGSVTGSAPTLSAQGTDTDIGVVVNSKGAGSVNTQVNSVTKLSVGNTVVNMTGNTYLFLGSFNGEGGELVFANTTGGTGPIIDVDGGNDWRWNTYNNTSNIKFNTGASATTKLQISANGNVGIGNTAPIDLLSVNGTTQITNSTASVFLAAANGNIGIGYNSPNFKLRVAGTIVGDANDNYFGTISGDYVDIGNLGATGSVYFDARGASSNVNVQIRAKGSADHIFTVAGGATEIVRFKPSGNVGIGNSAPTDKLRVEGTLSHLGLVPSTGTGIDQIFTATPSITLNTNWQSTGVTSTNLANGSYMVQLFANDIAAGGTANNEYYTGMMSWYSADTNSTVLDEIPLHRAGVSGSNNSIFLATQRTATANTSDLLLMISSAANNSSASTYTIKFRRMI